MKKTFIFLLALLLCLSAAGCGFSAENPVEAIQTPYAVPSSDTPSAASTETSVPSAEPEFDDEDELAIWYVKDSTFASVLVNISADYNEEYIGIRAVLTGFESENELIGALDGSCPI